MGVCVMSSAYTASCFINSCYMSFVGHLQFQLMCLAACCLLRGSLAGDTAWHTWGIVAPSSSNNTATGSPELPICRLHSTLASIFPANDLHDHSSMHAQQQCRRPLLGTWHTLQTISPCHNVHKRCYVARFAHINYHALTNNTLIASSRHCDCTPHAISMVSTLRVDTLPCNDSPHPCFATAAAARPTSAGVHGPFYLLLL
jgi:hypothetical protein